MPHLNPNLSFSLYITENKSCSFSASPSLFHGLYFSLVNENMLSTCEGISCKQRKQVELHAVWII